MNDITNQQAATATNCLQYYPATATQVGYVTPPTDTAQYRLELKGGGSVTLSAQGLFKMNEDERNFVFEILKSLKNHT